MKHCPPTLARAVRLSHKLFPAEPARITITRRPWWTGLILSHRWSRDWADAYRAK